MPVRPLRSLLAFAALSGAAHLGGCSSDVSLSADEASATGAGGSSAASTGAGGSGAASTGAGGSGATGGAGGAPTESCPTAWGHVLGGPGTQITRSVAIDSKGDVIVAAQHPAAISLDGAPLPSGPDDGYLLAGFDASGAHLWSRTFGGSAQNEYLPVVVDTHDDIIVAGSFHDAVDLGEGVTATAPGAGAFVAKLDAAGHPLWVRGFADASTAVPLVSLAVDGDGNVFFTGTLAPGESIDLGAVTVSSDAFLVKLAPDGHPIWARGWDGVELVGQALVTTPAGHVVLAGSFSGTTDLGGGPLTSAGDFDVFLVELDAHGEQVWSRRYGDADLQRAWALTRDPSGDLLLGGIYFHTFAIGGAALATPTSASFVARLDAAGALLWVRSLTAAAESVVPLAAPASGGVTLAGTAYDDYDVGCGVKGLGGSYSRAFVAHLDIGGDCAWQRDLGPADVQIVSGLAVDAAGRTALSGYFSGSIDFGQGPLVADEVDGSVTVITGPCPP